MIAELVLLASIGWAQPVTPPVVTRRNYPGGRDDSDLTVQPLRKQNSATVIDDDHGSNESTESPTAPNPNPGTEPKESGE